LPPFLALEGRAVAARTAIEGRDRVLAVRGRAVVESLSVAQLHDENAQLRRLLGLSARLQDGFVPAEVLPGQPGNEFRLALTVGRREGIVPFLPVVTGQGLVGMIERVDAQASEAITWAHPDFRVSAMSVDEVAFGIVQPHLGAGAQRWLLEMRGVPYRAAMDSGTLVVSSGLGATYPRGIPIGTVIGELATPEKWARTYLLRPAALSEAIGPVLVLQPARARGGVDGVWTTVARADSAARAAALAGDSLARQSAMDEVTARRRALGDTVPPAAPADSLRRVPSDTLGRAAPGRDTVRPPAGRPALQSPSLMRRQP
jgi:rod shape-determining protein MreC